jgi:hypothetical protein
MCESSRIKKVFYRSISDVANALSTILYRRRECAVGGPRLRGVPRGIGTSIATDGVRPTGASRIRSPV